ncbi:hypothetical protein SAMN05421730_100799 [Anaerobium acetethylicum]|uniref:Uncharacterized protein n=1 Tax=Anaerobium acetethylicum TaxID=1619234 RepID=A0A1D3TSW5_9FIRM|nr:hypothetical protein SAMN05421730_100799 [Anaerobium acetethylicum]
MKTLALRPRILRPYVPLRLHLSESALRINMFCITSSLLDLVQIDEYYPASGISMRSSNHPSFALIATDPLYFFMVFCMLFNPNP